MQLISDSYFSHSVVVKGQKARFFSVCKRDASVSTHEDWIIGELRNVFCEVTDKFYSWWVGVNNRQPANIQELHLHIFTWRLHAALLWSSVLPLPYTASNTGSYMGRVEWWLCLPLLPGKDYTPWKKGHGDSSSNSGIELSPALGRWRGLIPAGH